MNNSINDTPNIKGNLSDKEDGHTEPNYDRVLLEVLTLVGLISAATNVFLCFVIIKYRKLRKETTNTIFLQVNILQAVYLVATPTTIRLWMIESLSHKADRAFCISFQIESNLAFGSVWFIFLMLLDWYIKIYHKETYAKPCRVYTFFVLFFVLYFLIGVGVYFALPFCISDKWTFFTYVYVLICVGLFVLALCVINLIHAIRKRNIVVANRSGNFGLAMANLCVLCWVPCLIYPFTLIFLYDIESVTLTILIAIGHLSPVYNLIYLYFYDDFYHVFLKLVFKCRCSEYQSEPLNNPSVMYNDKSGVLMSDDI